MLQRYRLQVLSTVAGLLVGYLLLHPYAMLVYAMMRFQEFRSIPDTWQNLDLRAIEAFHPMMLPMAVSFALFGGVIGLLVGTLLERKKKLLAVEHENEKKRIALDTLREVMVTLAHHLLNANMIIGGKVRHCRKATSDQDILRTLDVIEEQGRKIDAVVGALRKATEIKIAEYTTGGTVKMIDVTREIEEQIAGAKKPG